MTIQIVGDGALDKDEIGDINSNGVPDYLEVGPNRSGDTYLPFIIR